MRLQTRDFRSRADPESVSGGPNRSNLANRLRALTCLGPTSGGQLKADSSSFAMIGRN